MQFKIAVTTSAMFVHHVDQATYETPPPLSATKDISSVSVVDKPARSDASSTSGTPDWSWSAMLP